MAVITDTFNRADSATSLGTTSDGSATWTAVLGTWGISSNQAYCPTLGTGAIGVATVPSTADATVQATISTDASNGVGLAFRVSNSTNYWILVRSTTGTNSGLWKVVAGAFTHVSTFTVSVGDVVTAVLSGSSITCKVNGSTVATPTDSFNSTATAHGIYTEATTNRLDTFSAGVPVAPTVHPAGLHVVSRAVLRAAVI